MVLSCHLLASRRSIVIMWSACCAEQKWLNGTTCVPCERGEVQLEPGKCAPCTQGSFTFSKGLRQQCTACRDTLGMVCPGADQVYSASGWWQPILCNDTQTSDECTSMERCISQDACVGSGPKNLSKLPGSAALDSNQTSQVAPGILCCLF